MKNSIIILISLVLLVACNCSSSAKKNSTSSNSKKKTLYVSKIICYKGRVYVKKQGDHYYTALLSNEGKYIYCKGKGEIKNGKYQASTSLEK